MTVTISDGTHTISPITSTITEYSGSQASRNVFHQILGRGDDDVSLAPASLRSGSLGLLFADAESFNEARQFVAAAAVFTYDDDEVPTAAMRFALDGELGSVINEESYTWILRLGYRELAS